jgi:hypothetical protein
VTLGCHRFCRVGELGKLHGPLGKLIEGQAQHGHGWSELATVAGARVVIAGGGKLAGAKEGRLASEGEHGVRRGAPGVVLKARASAAEERL